MCHPHTDNLNCFVLKCTRSVLHDRLLPLIAVGVVYHELQRAFAFVLGSFGVRVDVGVLALVSAVKSEKWCKLLER